MKLLWSIMAAALFVAISASQATAQAGPRSVTYRLYDGITAYIHNPRGEAMSIRLDLRDINLYAQGPREVLVKAYDPDGQVLVREIIPDDGVTQAASPVRGRGWLDELEYYTTLYAKGTKPSYRWSAWSEPKRLGQIAARSFTWQLPAGKPGVYRLLLAGGSDHYATLSITPDLKMGVSGHTTWIHGHGDMHQRQYIYIPQDTEGVFLAIIEMDRPVTRRFKLTGPDGRVLYDGQAPGGYYRSGGRAHDDTDIKFEDPASVAGKLLQLDVSPGAGDYLLKIGLQQPRKGAFADYLGTASQAILCDDPDTAMALRGGTFVEDGQVFWHPFQARFHRWLKANPPGDSEAQRELRAQIELVYNGMRLFETSDGPGSRSWTNWAYAFGYYGCKIWRTSWLLMKRDDLPDDLRAILREGLIMGGDRLSFAISTESGNGNAFAQIPVALWYCHRATGDAMQTQRFEVFWDRWTNEGFGPGVGLSRSGDAQEFHAHDMHYGAYIMDNWMASGNTWVKEGGILGDATDDDRFQKVMNRYYELYSYLYCRDPNMRPIPANPWSARTHMHAHKEHSNWEHGPYTWKGEPGPDLTVSVNDGDEWFAARRKGYYIVTFHGRISPEWTSRSFAGQTGFGGGILCQFTLPGKGPVLASVLTDSYGTGMHPSNWRNMRIHAVMGETWDGKPLISAISNHLDHAALHGNTATSQGEVRDTHVKVLREYVYEDDGVRCRVNLDESDYAEAMSVFTWERYWSEVKFAYEVIPFLPVDQTGKVKTTVTLLDGAGQVIGEAGDTLTQAHAIRINRNGFGVDVKLDAPARVKLGANHTVMIEIVPEGGDKPVPAKTVAIAYKLSPFVE